MAAKKATGKKSEIKGYSGYVSKPKFIKDGAKKAIVLE